MKKSVLLKKPAEKKPLPTRKTGGQGVKRARWKKASDKLDTKQKTIFHCVRHQSVFHESAPGKEVLPLRSDCPRPDRSHPW